MKMAFAENIPKINSIENKRKNFIRHFNREYLESMTIDQYVIGGGDKENFCYRIEFEQVEMGDIRGSLAGVKRYWVWRDKDTGDYATLPRFKGNAQEAFLAIRGEICHLLDAGEVDDYETIGKCPVSNLFKYKILAMYYPNKFLSIYSLDHLTHYCNMAGILPVEGDDELTLQRKLLQWKEAHDEVRDLSLLEYAYWLYSDEGFGRPPKEKAMTQSRPMLSKLREELRDYDSKHSKKRLTEYEQTVRNAKVTAFVKERANGFCQLCGKPAPFYNVNGEPYLECHHIIWISNNGPDEPSNAVALCPNCHRKMHTLKEESDIKRLTKIANEGL